MPAMKRATLKLLSALVVGAAASAGAQEATPAKEREDAREGRGPRRVERDGARTAQDRLHHAQDRGCDERPSDTENHMPGLKDLLDIGIGGRVTIPLGPDADAPSH